jgi:hypothetical protein
LNNSALIAVWKEHFDLDPNTGVLTRKYSGGGQEAGAIVGSLHKRKGYLYAGVKSKVHLVHRIVFGMHFGWLPKGLDHIDGDKLNNRPDNLRPCDQSQNNCNRGAVTGKFKGVSWYAPLKKYVAQIQAKGIKKNLGYFSDPVNAAKAYDKAALQLHGAFARTNF